MSIEIYVKYSAEIKFVFHCILYFSHVKKVVWAFWLADIFLPKKFDTCSQANVNMESDFVNLSIEERDLWYFVYKKSRKIMKKYICGFIKMR